MQEMNADKIISHIDNIILFCLCVLVVFLPIAHTESIRAFSLGIPAVLWVIKMVLLRRTLLSRTPLDMPVLLFTFVATLSVITAVDWKYSLEEFIGEWIIDIFLFYLVVHNLQPQKMKYILGALLIGNLVMVSYGLFDFFYNGGQLFEYRIRASSLHYGFGAYSTYLVTVTPYLVIAFFLAGQLRHRLFLLFLLLINFFNLFITHSRGSWLAVGVLLFFAGWRFLPKIAVLLVATIVGVGFFLITPGKILFHHAPITQLTTPKATIETMDARWELLKFCLAKITEKPFQMLGYGQRSFVKKYPDFYMKYKGALLWQAHNTFMNVALQTGLQGLVLFCFILYKFLTIFHESQRGEKLLKFFCLATFMMIIAIFVRNFSDDFFKDDTALLFWFLTGAGVALNKGKGRNDEHLRDGNRLCGARDRDLPGGDRPPGYLHGPRRE
jgi:O-antigen ligase